MNSYKKSLGDHLILRTATSREDVERVAATVNKPHQPEDLSKDLILNHPNTRIEDLFYVEDEESGQIVSYLSWIPWTWCIDGIEVPAGEVSGTVTLEPYRHRGLVREQMALFMQKLRERGCLLSQVSGIPYFYRQFGYEYALPMEVGYRLKASLVPDFSDSSFKFRLATHDDLPTLLELYSTATKELVIHSIRSDKIWNYLLTYANGGLTQREYWLILDSKGKSIGYFCVLKHPYSRALLIKEISSLDFDTSLAVVEFLKLLARDRDKLIIQLNLPEESTVMQVAHWLGGKSTSVQPWQIYIPDIAALIRVLGPAIERRIADSAFAEITREVRICLFRNTIILRFDQGKLVDVSDVGFTNWDEEPIRFPPPQFIPMVLGYRSAEELESNFPDISIRQDQRQLIDTLFPKLSSFIYSIY